MSEISLSKHQNIFETKQKMLFNPPKIRLIEFSSAKVEINSGQKYLNFGT